MSSCVNIKRQMALVGSPYTDSCVAGCRRGLKDYVQNCLETDIAVNSYPGKCIMQASGGILKNHVSGTLRTSPLKIML
jgi:hypothetical protein